MSNNPKLQYNHQQTWAAGVNTTFCFRPTFRGLQFERACTVPRSIHYTRGPARVENNLPYTPIQMTSKSLGNTHSPPTLKSHPVLWLDDARGIVWLVAGAQRRAGMRKRVQRHRNKSEYII